MPSLRQLEYLVALSETLHFRKAAERVNTTQPTLSEQIKALEKRLGTTLVERTATRVVFTPVGAEVLEVARRMLKDAGEIKAIASSAGRDLAGLLRLGLPPTIGPYLMERAAPELHRTYPDLRLYVREEVPAGLPRALEEGKYDVIVCPLPIKGADLESISLFQEELILTVASDHPLAKKESVALSDLKGQNVLTLGMGHQLHDAAVELCKSTGARLRHDFEGTSLDMLREMVVMGLGVTFMPGLYAKSELVRDSAIRLVDVSDRRLFRTIGIAWRKSAAQRRALETLADFFKAMNRNAEPRQR